MLLRNKHFSATIALLLLLISSCGTQQAEEKKEEEPSMVITKGLGAIFSPNEKKIAFYSYEGMPEGRGSIYTANLDGTGLVQVSLNDTVGMHTEPVWSKDGKKIAYTNFYNDGATLKVLDVETKVVNDLPMIPDGGYNMFSGWGNEEGQYFFFHWPRGGFEPDAYFYNGSEIQRMTTDGKSARPWVSPEGDIYVAKIINEEQQDYAVHLYDMKTKSSQKLTDDDEFFYWQNGFVIGKESRNDSIMIYEGNIKTHEEVELSVVPVKDIMFPHRTRDGRLIIFNSGWEDGTNIHILELESQKLNKLTFTN